MSFIPTNTNDLSTAPTSYFPYKPSEGAAILFVVLFALVNVVLFGEHIVQCQRFTRRFPREKFLAPLLSFIPFLLGAQAEFVAYILRAVLTHDTANLGVFIAEAVLAMLAPTMFTATFFYQTRMIVGWTEPNFNFSFRLFFYGDMICRILQGVGSGDLTSNYKTGRNLIITGLALQIALISYYILTMCRLAMISNRYKGFASTFDTVHKLRRIACTTFSICCLFILARNVIRIVEFAAHTGNYLVTHEWITYVFDAALMFLVCVVMGVTFFMGNNIFKIKEALITHTASLDKSEMEDVYETGMPEQSSQV